MRSNVELSDVHYDVMIDEVNSYASVIDIHSEVDEDYRTAPEFRITDDDEIRILEENNEIRIV